MVVLKGKSQRYVQEVMLWDKNTSITKMYFLKDLNVILDFLMILHGTHKQDLHCMFHCRKSHAVLRALPAGMTAYVRYIVYGTHAYVLCTTLYCTLLQTYYVLHYAF